MMSKKKRNSSRREVIRRKELDRMFQYFQMSNYRREQVRMTNAFGHMDLSWIKNELEL